MSDGGIMGFGGGLMWPLWILLIVVFIAVVRGLGGNNTSSGSYKRSPLRILEERYARGEIDEQEFEQRKRKLED